MKRIRTAIVVVLMCTVALSLGIPAWAADTIKIGVIGPMQFVQGKGHWNGATLAAEEINAKGGVNVGGKKMKIELIKADSNEFLNVTEATNAMELLMAKEKVDFVVGGFRTEAVLAMQDIAMEYKKIFIGCGAAHPELCNRVAENYNTYKYFFRGTPFNSKFLVKTSFLHLKYVGDILKSQLDIPALKVAIVAEKAMWADPMVTATEGFLPKIGMEVAGIWRPSAVATDLTAELKAIQSSGAQMIYTIFSSSVGIPFARQCGELKIPAVQVGINVEAQKDGFYAATQGMGNYVFTMGTYCRGVAYNELTTPFVESYVKRFGETPPYTADTYSAIALGLVPAIEKVGSLDSNKLVKVLEQGEHKSPAGMVKMMLDEQGRQTHDLTWGPGYLTSLGIQWQNGKPVGVWPNQWKATPESEPLTYKGIQDYKIPPWVVEAYKKK